MPQMYWYTIGTTVDDVFAHTYEFNLLYGRPIYPLGQVYGSPPTKQVLRFRQVSRLYHAPGVSWWDWQEAAPRYFTAISRPIGALHGVSADETFASLGKGAQGDVVVWAQEHLDGAGYTTAIDGDYWGRARSPRSRAFQTAEGLHRRRNPLGPATWAALLHFSPLPGVVWTTHSGATVAPSAASVRSARAVGIRVLMLAVPKSAHAARGPRRALASVARV